MGRFRFEPAPDVAAEIGRLVDVLGFAHIDPARVHCRRSRGSTADAYARIWELPSVWQDALGVPPQYVVEVLSEHFDPLDEAERTKILIHELLHIPRTFSGAVRNHRGSGERIDGHTVNRYYRRYLKTLEERRLAEEREREGQMRLPF
jgi:predicted metallopeptidase